MLLCVAAVVGLDWSVTEVRGQVVGVDKICVIVSQGSPSNSNNSDRETFEKPQPVSRCHQSRQTELDIQYLSQIPIEAWFAWPVICCSTCVGVVCAHVQGCTIN